MDDTLIPADSARWLVNQLIQSGICHDGLLSGTGLDMAWLKQQDARISMSKYVRIVENALSLTREPALGLTVGKSQMLFEYGVWGYAIMSCSTAGEAMNVAFKYWELNGALVDVNIEMGEDRIFWSISPSFSLKDEKIIRFAIEEFISTTVVACSFLFDKPMSALRLDVAYSRPDYGERYSQMVQCPVYFDSKKTVLTLDRKMMTYPTVTGHAAMKNHCENLCRELSLKLSKADQLISTVRQVVIQSMGRFPKAEDVAQVLSMSPRTFYRRLQERETTYQTILDEVRAELAVRYLKDTHLSVDQVSDLIGFTETTTFRRTFKKWTGYSPSEFRKEIMAL